MEVFHTAKALRSQLDKHRGKKQTIGLVPTMGALHDGHLSLMKEALRENDVIVVSIFVNPTQFDRSEDLENYPRTLEADLDMLERLNGIVYVFHPAISEMYGNAPTSGSFSFGGLEHQMEGKYRKGHFDGVGTIVSKLLKTVAPKRAYFGEKDFQQLQIIRKLVSLQNLPVEIIGCPISREDSGLARSSRNERLSQEERQKAAHIYKILTRAKDYFGTKSANELRQFVTQAFAEQMDMTLEYAEVAEETTLLPAESFEPGKKYRLFVAVFLGPVRLIDNIALN